MGTAVPAKSEFNRALHLTRGLAIFLVVLGHSLPYYLATKTTLDDATVKVIYRRSVWLRRLAMGDWKQSAPSSSLA
jgi:peptidoglycan/LPS O-acetylase OafA/YrhL